MPFLADVVMFPTGLSHVADEKADQVVACASSGNMDGKAISVAPTAASFSIVRLDIAFSMASALRRIELDTFNTLVRRKMFLYLKNSEAIRNISPQRAVLMGEGFELLRRCLWIHANCPVRFPSSAPMSTG